MKIPDTIWSPHPDHNPQHMLYTPFQMNIERSCPWRRSMMGRWSWVGSEIQGHKLHILHLARSRYRMELGMLGRCCRQDSSNVGGQHKQGTQLTIILIWKPERIHYQTNLNLDLILVFSQVQPHQQATKNTHNFHQKQIRNSPWH